MSHNLGLTVDGIMNQPIVYEREIAIRECLDLTLSFDYDIVDGAQTARFATCLINEIETVTALE